MSARLVYRSGPDGESSDHRRNGCSRCGTEPCRCAPTGPAGPVHVRRERSGRKGKTVTVAEPLALDRDEARALVRELKRELGSGGSARALDEPGRVAIEIQGDHVERLAAALRRRGHDARAGGAGR